MKKSLYMQMICFFIFPQLFLLNTLMTNETVHIPNNVKDRESKVSWKQLEKQQEALPNDLLQWLAKQNISINTINEALKDKPNLFKVYKKLNEYSEVMYKTKPSTISYLQANKAKNRQKYTPCFDYTLSCREIPNFYINASDIYTPRQEYIATQAPMFNTVYDFWKMVLHRNSRLIVAVAMPTELGSIKCEPYWEMIYFPFTCGDWCIKANYPKLVSFTRAENQQIQLRIFNCYNKRTEENRNIAHLHYENWKDQCTPNTKVFHELLTLMDKYNTKKNPITVHCSAGFGRTGTVIAAHTIRTLVSNKALEASINIPQTLFFLRMQRPHLVTTRTQFISLYELFSYERILRLEKIRSE